MKQINPYQRLEIQPIQLQEICQQWKIIELALFGSILRDNLNPESDRIDILVSFANGARITFFDLEAIEEKLSRLFDLPVDYDSRSIIISSRSEFQITE